MVNKKVAPPTEKQPKKSAVVGKTKQAARKIKYAPGLVAGLDENGLGPRLGPLVVTASLAEIDAAGARLFARQLPQALRQDLDDSKALVTTKQYSLAEAWARVVVEHTEGKSPETPSQLLEALCPESSLELRKMCPSSTKKQCWNNGGEEFTSSDEQLQRLRAHIIELSRRGVHLRRVRSDVVCTGLLNDLKERGIHRFAADLHAMERLILTLREEGAAPLVAVCGKVGGIGKYEPFFGPLAGRLHTALEEGQALSSYYFPGLGTLHFQRDADATDPLVMLSSLVGKYVRELLMARIARFYADGVEQKYASPSGYHDPVTNEFVKQTAPARKKLKIVSNCFERVPAQ